MGFEGLTRHALAISYVSGNVFVAGALLQHFLRYLQSCPMSLCMKAVARLPSGFSDGLHSFRPGVLKNFPEIPPTDA